jgi:hypothetical protein
MAETTPQTPAASNPRPKRKRRPAAAATLMQPLPAELRTQLEDAFRDAFRG